MERETEVLDTQNDLEVTAPEAGSAELGLTPEQIADLKHRADVSSQNFERAKKAEEKARELEEHIATLETTATFETEEGEDVGALRKELAEMRGFMTKQQVLETYPQLKEVWSDFESFRNNADNKGMSPLTAAKAFIIEKDITPVEQRKGLEKPIGGGKRVAPSNGMTNEEIKKLRETDYKKYVELNKKGLIKFS